MIADFKCYYNCFLVGCILGIRGPPGPKGQKGDRGPNPGEGPGDRPRCPGCAPF